MGATPQFCFLSPLYRTTMRSLVLLLALVGVSVAQFENGHVKILQDRRYQQGASFGNFRNQEDGIKYQEETDPNGIRRGYWEYPDETGRIVRTEFEAGPGIGFKIVSSNNVHQSIHDNHAAPSPAAAVRQSAAPARVTVPAQPQPAVVRPHVPPTTRPILTNRLVQPVVTTTTPAGPINLFDYPANLDFSRHGTGHSFSVRAVN